jgi:hypothetical protein
MEFVESKSSTAEEELPTPITSYTDDELRQLRELVMQSYTHYDKLLKDEKLMATLKEGDALALRLCFRETNDELAEVDAEIALRKK